MAVGTAPRVGTKKKLWQSQRQVEIILLILGITAVAASAVYVTHQQTIPLAVIVGIYVLVCMTYKLKWDTPTILGTLAFYPALAVLDIFYTKSYYEPLGALGAIIILMLVSIRQSGDEDSS